MTESRHCGFHFKKGHPRLRSNGTPDMGVNLWGAASFGKPVPGTKTKLETNGSIPAAITQSPRLILM
ncbi:hypothetical protein Pla52n_60260 [Stieleria varia]|uniref:Uncharacterized protein n=1 Tax=Stieleria varia TaxID=2528005 RepID=A0A5C6A043_9BACT|nr:hypothetical protein Pla52n_60260 [Stieleria varia]